MNAADYADWCDFAGFYLGNVSHVERYRAYQPKISPAGFSAVIVRDFLGHNEGGIDLQRWRSGDVYEVGADADFRIEQTAKALEAIGATRMATKVRAVQDTSPFAMFSQLAGNPQAMRDIMAQADLPAMMADLRSRIARVLPVPPGFPVPEQKPAPLDKDIETWEQVEHLLDKFVSDHQAELRGDVEKYGDVRAQPGFDPEKRRRELDDMRRHELDLQRQREQVDKMRQHIARLEKQLTKDPNLTPAKAATPRRAILECYREYSGRPAAGLIPEMRDWLADAAALQEKHAAIFRPQPTQDKELLKRLVDLGSYRVDLDDGRMTAIWESPRGMDCDWADFSLVLEAPAGKKKPLRTLLDTCDRLRRRFDEHQAELRREVLENFEIHRPQIHGWAFDDYERDAAGNITEAAIFKAAGGGRIHVNLVEEDVVEISVFFHVAWDDEHGLELCIVDEAEEAETDDETPEWSGLIQHGGPILTPADVAAFEKRHQIALPRDYRTFLLTYNGGVPHPNHFKTKAQGSLIAIDVERFFSIMPSEGEDDPRSLDTALHAHRTRNLPGTYLPIGTVLVPDPVAEQVPSHLLLALGGKGAGKVHVAMQSRQRASGAAGQAMNEQMAALMAQMYEMFCPQIANSIAAFLSKLVDRPDKEIPAWLAAIRAGDIDTFAKWLTAGGKLGEQFIPYGAIASMSVTDFLSREATPGFLKELFDRKVVRPSLVMESWARLGSSFTRLTQLLPVLPKDQWARAFSSWQIWDEPELLERLIEAKVDLNAGIDGEGATPLHFAVRARRPDLVRWLIEHGALPGKADDFGRTALIWAESERELECLKVLLEAGESLARIFPHMPTMKNKLGLFKRRWLGQFDELAVYLRERGFVTADDLAGL